MSACIALHCMPSHLHVSLGVCLTPEACISDDAPLYAGAGVCDETGSRNTPLVCREKMRGVDGATGKRELRFQ